MHCIKMCDSYDTHPVLHEQLMSVESELAFQQLPNLTQKANVLASNPHQYGTEAGESCWYFSPANQVLGLERIICTFLLIQRTKTSHQVVDGRS